MKKEKRNFLPGARKLGYAADVADQVFALIEPFAGYAFNKAHSSSYALIAYQTAYLKANYPAEYITAFLVTHSDQLEKVATAVAECRRLGIEVLTPDVNRSQVNFSIETDQEGKTAIRFGLNAIKNVGLGAVEPLVAERQKNGEFKSIEDLCRRVDLRGINRRAMESLIKAGALDRLYDRGTLLNNVGRILALAQREQRLRETGQSTMFDLFGDAAPVPLAALEMAPSEVSDHEKASWEKELIGVSFSEKPFSPVVSGANPDAIFCGQIDAELAGQDVVVAGRIISARYLLTRDSRPFASVRLEDFSGQAEAMVWPRVYAATKELWQEGNEVVVQGKVRVREDEVQINCDSARFYEPVPAAPALAKEPEPPPPPPKRQRLVINLSQTSDAAGDTARLHRLVDILRDFPGRDEVNLSVVNGGRIINLKLSNIYTGYCPELHQRLVELVGEEGLKVEADG
jgi:DNA polymerase-3 subunit alpha